MSKLGLDEKVPFTQHLEELRWRLVVNVLSLAVFFIISYFFSDWIILVIQTHFAQKLVFISPTEAFFAKMKVSFLTAIIFCVPVILYHTWGFISPGLHDNEKKFGFPIVIGGTFFFLAGALFAYYLVLPIGLQFLLSFATEDLLPMISVSNFLSFIMKIMIAFGVVFQYPLIIFILSRMGIVSSKFLAEKRKYAILIIAVVSAILTPPDVITQVLMIIPLSILYEIGVFIAKVFEKSREK